MRVNRLQRWWLSAWPHRIHIRRFVPRFLRACPDPFRGEVLEVGSGGGFTSRRILETFPQVELTATDIDAQMEHGVERLQDKYGQRLKWRRADLMNLPFDRSSFDIVIAINVLHDISDLKGAVQQIIRVLRPGGLIGLGGEGSYLPGLKKILFEEECEVVRLKEGVCYYIWARKSYPIEVK
ncbi:MAG: class I SAM-dependent methyltransferase [bacterium]